MSILLSYQQQLFRMLDQHQVLVCEKSRRIGMTWTAAAYAVLLAAQPKQQGGMDTLYMGYNLDMTREFMSTAHDWAKAYQATGVPFLRKNVGAQNRLLFRSGNEIKALSAQARSLRGRQGLVIVDEAAYHEDLEGLLKAAMALQIWGGKLLIISTHFGVGNAFHRMIQAIRAEKVHYGLLRVTFDQALDQGLYHRIQGKPLAASLEEEKTQWALRIRADYGEAAAEELDCIPSQPHGRYFARDMLEKNLIPAPVRRYSADQDAEANQWFEQEIPPLIAQIRQNIRKDHLAIGVDFGRHHDLSVIYVLRMHEDLQLSTALVIELSATAFVAQWEILKKLVSALPYVAQIVMDKGGIGGYLHEQAEHFFGKSLVQGIQLSREWYAQVMPNLRAAFEAEQIGLPKDRLILDDLSQIALINHIPRPLPRRSGRHADSAIALALAFQASKEQPRSSEVVLGEKRLFAEFS